LTALTGFNALAVAIATPFAVAYSKRIKPLSEKVGSVEAKVTEVHEQTVNHHPQSPNMREENDSRHAETVKMFQHVDQKVDRLATTMEDVIGFGLTNRYMIEELDERTQESDRSKQRREGADSEQTR